MHHFGFCNLDGRVRTDREDTKGVYFKDCAGPGPRHTADGLQEELGGHSKDVGHLQDVGESGWGFKEETG